MILFLFQIITASCERSHSYTSFQNSAHSAVVTHAAKAETLDFSPRHFQEVFRKCFHQMKENKGNIVKECGTDVESFQFFVSFLFHVYAYL